MAGFLTEHQCRYVPMLNPAIDAGRLGPVPRPDTLDAVKGRVALCLDVAPDLRHATLIRRGPTR
jgi:hypothetical protein